MKKFLAGLFVVPLLVGCGADSNGGARHEDSQTNVTYHSKIVVDGDTDNQVYEFTLSDGTKCVFIDGDQESGLSCGWVDTP